LAEEMERARSVNDECRLYGDVERVELATGRLVRGDVISRL